MRPSPSKLRSQSPPWPALQSVLDKGHRFLLTSHLFPEADSIGSEVALALHLRDLGKDVCVVNDAPAPERYAFLTRHFPVGSFEDLVALENGRGFDVAVTLDVSSWDYTGDVGAWIRAHQPSTTLVSVDHHRLRGRFGDLDINMEGAASAGDVLYRYFRAVDASITPAMAEALYASVLFDTGGLRMSNADNDTVRVASELVALGAQHREVCAHLFEWESWPRMNLLRLALGTLQRRCEGRLAWITINDDLFRLADAEFVDGDGILDHLLGLREVEVCVMFRQMGPQGVKATFRSKGRQDVSHLAEELGGGGRTTASGVLLRMSLHEAMETVLPRAHALLQGTEPAFETTLQMTLDGA